MRRGARFVFGIRWLGAVFLVLAMTPRGAHAQQSPTENQRTVWDGVYSEEQAERGQVLYTESCAGCHAADLRGDNTSPSLVGMSFEFLWGGSTLGELFTRVQERMPTDRPGSLSAQTYRDILAFVLRANSYPAGPEPLGDDVLDHILITANPGREP